MLDGCGKAKLGYVPVWLVTYNGNTIKGKERDMAAAVTKKGRQCILGFQGTRGRYQDPEKPVTMRRVDRLMLWEFRTKLGAGKKKAGGNPAGVAIMTPARLAQHVRKIYTPRDLDMEGRAMILHIKQNRTELMVVVVYCPHWGRI